MAEGVANVGSGILFSEAELPPIVRALRLRPGVSMCARDERRRIQWCCPNFAKQFGQTPGDLVGSTLCDAYGDKVANSRLTAMQPELWQNGMYSCIQVWGGMRITSHTWNRNYSKGDKYEIVSILDPRPIAQPELDAQLPTLLEPNWGTFNKLSRRELEVLYLVAVGYSAEETAKLLCRAEKTIDNQVASLYEKLGVHNRAEVTRIAVERGLHAFTREQWFAIAARYPKDSQAGNLKIATSTTSVAPATTIAKATTNAA